MSLMRSQLDFVPTINSKSAGIVMRKSRGLIDVIFWIAVTADIRTDILGSYSLSAKYGTNLSTESELCNTSL